MPDPSPMPAVMASPSGDGAWRRWLVRAVGLGAAVPLALLAALALVDPYDTGRPLPLGLRGTPAESPRLANAARARDPHYRAAIFGNSHVQLLSPARLTAATGLDTVSLTVPGSGVREKVALIDWFVRHRRQPPALLVVGVDEFECHRGPAVLQTNPFPFWLYATRDAAYVGGLFNTRAVSAAAERLAMAARGKLVAPDDGYWDYEAGRTWSRPALGARPPDSTIPGARPEPVQFPGVDMLAEALFGLPAETKVILVRAPVHGSVRPARGTEAAQVEEACRLSLEALTRSRTGTVMLDYRNDDPAWDDAGNFWDESHVRRPVAERIEGEIARLARAGGAS